MLPLIVVAMAVSAHGVSVPDIVSIGMAPIDWCLELLHGKHLRTPQWLVDQPQAQLPTVDEIDELSSSEAQQRREFYLSVLVLLFLLTVALGTAVMILGPSLRSHSRKRAVEPEYEPFEPGQGGGLSVSFQRKLVCAAFSCIALASAAACVFSIKTDRLSKSTGLDWEVYVLLFCMTAIFFLVQAVFAVLWLPAGHTFAVSAFAEAAFTGLFPVISDLFDTLKDTIFAALCFQSRHIALQIMGVASWIYLIGIHVYILTHDNTLAELGACYLPVLLAPPEPKAAKAAQGVGRLAKLLSAVLFMMYKQCTPTKRELLLLENVPQALLSVAFLLVEGGSAFVLVINLAIPAAQVLATFIFFRPLLACVAPQLGKKLQGFLDKPDYLKAKHMWLEAWQDDLQLLRAAIPQLVEVEFINDLVKELNLQEMEHDQKLLEFFRDCLDETIENEGIIDLEKARDGREVLECTGILDAVERGRRLGAVRHFLQKDPEALRETAADGSTALHVASAQGHVQVVELLFASNASLESKTNDGTTPLHLASAQGCEDVVRWLVAKVAQLDAATKDGSTALHVASAQGHAQVVELLFGAKASLESKANDGTTPLHLASAQGREDVVRWLVAKVAQLDAATKDGQTPSDLAAASGQSEIVKILQEAQALDEKAAAKYPDQLSGTDQRGILQRLRGQDKGSGDDDPGICRAAEAGDLPAVRGLLRADPGAVRRTKNGWTAMHSAALNDHSEVLAALAAAGGDLEARTDSTSETPLHRAAFYGRASAVAQLLALRAEVGAKDDDGDQPLHVAARRRHLEVVKLLAAANAAAE